MSDVDLGALKSIFLEEAVEIFDEIDRILLQSEVDGALSSADINSLFRAVHTIKGNSGAMELLLTASFAHEVETFMGKLREGAVEFKPQMTVMLINCADILRVVSESEMDDSLSKDDCDALTLSLREQLKNISLLQSDNKRPAQPREHIVEEHIVETMLEQSPIEPKRSSAKEMDLERQLLQKQSSKLGTIRVDLSKIDTLMNGVGELVIASSMLHQLNDLLEDAKLKSEFTEKMGLLYRHIKELQDAVMSVRMVPMEQIYAKFPKVIRDTAAKLDKKVVFTHSGDDVEIDKAMIEGLTDPLMHIIRNSLDHGIESSACRIKKGKDENGHIFMNAQQANGQIIIKIIDDGGGVDFEKVTQKAIEKGIITSEQAYGMSDDEKCEIIFSPGFSTASEVTDISGRGVGMDVVKTNINKLGGVIRVGTKKGQGTTISIVLPLTLAILDGLNVGVGDMQYIIPVASIAESLQPSEDMVKKVGSGEGELLMLRGEFIPILRLHRLFSITPKFENIWEGMLIVVKSDNRYSALFVDEFLHQQQVVVKPLEKNFRQVDGIGAATVRGDGTIGLILDVLGLTEKQKEYERTGKL